ncbi:42493_t:CDS:2, partial [Gigaspora margarita]
SEKCIYGNAIYRSNEQEFRELTYKGFVTQESLITELEKNSIVLMVGRYMLEDTEYLTLIQTVPISTSSNEIEITSDDLPYTPPLLLFSVPVIPNSYFSNNEYGRESLMLYKKLYNGITGYKNIESKVKDWYQKMLYIIALDIEWNYAGNEQTSDNSNKGKTKAQIDINNHLESIEERYANSRKKQRTNLLPSSPSKPQKTDPQPNNSTPQNNKSLAKKFLQAVDQIKNAGPVPQK